MKNLFLVFTLLTSMSVFAAPENSSSYTIGNRSTAVKTDDFGLGLKVGSLTGITGKYWMDEDQGFDATVAFPAYATLLNVDYLWHFRQAMANMTRNGAAEQFVPYLGAGLITGVGYNGQFFNRDSSSFGLGVRVPFGVEFLPRAVRLGAFAELALDFGLTPTTYSFLTLDIGARYYF